MEKMSAESLKHFLTYLGHMKIITEFKIAFVRPNIYKVFMRHSVFTLDNQMPIEFDVNLDEMELCLLKREIGMRISDNYVEYMRNNM